MIINVKKAGTASPRYFQLISTTFLIMSDPEMTNAPPVAQGGIEANTAEIGKHKTGSKKCQTRTRGEEDRDEEA
jgi:hypothetical protein